MGRTEVLPIRGFITMRTYYLLTLKGVLRVTYKKISAFFKTDIKT